MREALFIKQGTKKWSDFEKNNSTDPDVLAEQFIVITDDLAYAKTFFPKSKTTVYLNGLAARFHQSIYKNKKESNKRFAQFWKTELPLLFAQYRKQLLYSFIFFMVFCLIGIISAKYDNSFLRLVLGDGYVNMTNENIAKGDPFGVYKSEEPFLMFYRIAEHNITVTAVTFVAGLFFTAGTVYLLLYNGIMVGSFEYYFFSKGLGLKSVLVVFLHGTIEMSCIVIAAGAGIVLGNSLIFPKTYSRVESVKKGAKDGMKIMLGILPLIVVAASIEGFVTRHTEMPMLLSGGIVIVSFLFMLSYVVIYPAILSRKLNQQ